MLERVLEPEVMESNEEAQTYDAMDHSEVNRRFVADLLFAGFSEGDILDLGTGTAQIPIELCGRVKQIRVVAVDAAVSMLELAKRNIESSRLSDQIEVILADAKQIPFDSETFGAVISNSIVHHIPEPAMVCAEAVRVLRQGGRIFFRDLARPATDSDLARLVLTYTKGESDHAKKLFADSLRAALTVDEMRRIVAALGMDASAVQWTSDRHWTWSDCKTKACTWGFRGNPST